MLVARSPMERLAPEADSAQLDAAQLVRIQSFRDRLAVLEDATDELLAARTARMAGARVVNPGSHNFRYFLLPEPSTGCPALGPLALSWDDVFNVAKANLRELAALRPPRWTGGEDVIRWVRAVRWNAILLQDASNIRPIFRYPQDVEGNFAGSAWLPSAELQRRGSSTTLVLGTDDGGTIEGAPYPGLSSGSDGIGIPIAVRQRLRDVAARWSEEDPRGGLGYALPLWMTMLDWTAAWPNVDSFGPGFMFFPRVGDAPGSIVDLDLSAYGRGFVPLLRRAIDEAWRTGKHAWAAPGPLTSPYPAGNVGAWVSPWRLIDDYVAIAEGYASLDLPTMLLESIGWYVYNHLPYWRNRGVISLDETAIRTLQQSAASARMRQGLAPVGAVASLAQTVNPIVGAVVSALQEIGFELLDAFIVRQISSDGPRRLFVRNYPSSCTGVVEEELTTETEGGLVMGAITEREAQAARDRAAVEELDAVRRELADRRAPEVPWKEIAIGAGVALAVGVGVHAWRKA